MCWGVPSSSTFITLSIKCLLLQRISSAISTLRIGSTRTQSKPQSASAGLSWARVKMSIAEMMTPTEPMRSARTCWNAPSTFMLCPDDRCSTHAAAMFIRKPPVPTMSTGSPST